MFKMTDMNKKLNEQELNQVAGGGVASELIKQYTQDALNKSKNQDVTVQESSQDSPQGSPNFINNTNNGNTYVYSDHSAPIYMNSNNGNMNGSQNINYKNK